MNFVISGIALILTLLGFGNSVLIAQEKENILYSSEEISAIYGDPIETRKDYREVVPKSTYFDMGDYYYLNNGRVASFLRQKSTYLIISDPRRVSAQRLSQTIQAQFDKQLSVVKEHSLGGYVMVHIKQEDQTDSILSALYQTDPSIFFISQVLKSKERGGTLAILPEIIVKISADADQEEAISELEGMNLTLLSKLVSTETEFEFKLNEHIHDVGRIFEITRKAADLPFVDWAEPNFLVSPTKQFTPNDPMYNDQWHLNNTGQNGAAIDADIDAPEGWDISQGNGTVIAIFDDSVDTAHEDLTIWSNPGESGGGKETNGIDDDDNGYIDDYQGWDFGDNDNDPSPSAADDNHGTAVAGVAGAIGDNGIGVAGGALGAVILPVRRDVMTCTDWGNAMRYAGKYADVVNNSWGISACESALNSAIYDVVDGNIPNARRGSKGTPVLFATGNSASGWRRFLLRGFPEGTYNFHWKFVKDQSGSEGYDTVWLDNITWPGGATTDFETDAVGNIPNGFTSDGAATWSVVSDGVHTRGAAGKSVKAGTISHNQGTNLRITKAVGAGTLTYWVWVSTEYGYDFLEFYVNGYLYHKYSPGQYGVHTNEVGYPASNPDTIAVGASTDGAHGGVEERSYYSQFGPEVDVVAPSSGGGQRITTTDRMGADGYDDLSNYTSDFGGTSSATPLVAGIVANLLAARPDITADQVRHRLRTGADKIGPYLYTAGRNDYYGYGRANLFKTFPEEPEAAFTASPTSGIAPLAVNFNDQSTGDITSWSWDFGDGSTSTQQNPSYTYTNPGTYTVSLTVTGPEASDTKTKTDFISVSQPPISCQPSEGTIGTQFTIFAPGCGAKKGNVTIESMKCKVLEWTNTSICSVLKKVSLRPGKYDLTVTPKDKGVAPIIMKKAFSIMAPVIQAVTTSGNSATITGLFFGTKKVKAYLVVDGNGKRKKLKVTSLQMNPGTGDSQLEVTVSNKVMKKLKRGSYDVRVENKIGSDAFPNGFTVE